MVSNPLLVRRHNVRRVVYRYVSGRPLDGRPGYPYLKPGEGRWPGWKRQAWRLGVPAAAYVTVTEPVYTGTAAGLVVTAIAWRARRRWVTSRFDAQYVTPTLAALQPALNARLRLHVDPGLGSLTPRLAKPLSPAEEAVRRWYGEHVEPVLRWPGDQVMRGLWTIQRFASPVTSRVAWALRRPGGQSGPRIELSIDSPYITKEQRQLVSSIISAKIPVSDLVESWQQVGPRVVATWTLRRRPPAFVGYADVSAALGQLQEFEFFLGLGAGGKPVTISLRDDSPHIAVSAGSGAGKSVLAQLLAAQVLARGGRVVIVDRKGSHRWALGLANVDYCTKPAQMHDALIRLAALADERNTLALHEPEDWDPGERVLVICEELNATLGQLTVYWAEVRGKGEPKRSPAVSALGDLLFMGRSAKVNVVGIAQMLSARSIGGPEARENFAIRCLARYTSNAWKMLCCEAAMPRASRTLGRWQVVVGGQAVETQVAYLTGAQARAIAAPVPVSPQRLDGPLSRNVPGDRDMVTLREAVDQGVIPWGYEASKKRLQRKIGDVPTPRGKRGQADLYTRADLERWAGRIRYPSGG